MKVVIAGGGTGGHLYPGIALAEQFQKLKSETQILFIGTSHGIGTGPLPKTGFLSETVLAKGFIGKGVFSRIKSILSVPIGLIQSLQILVRFGPQIVIGIGGYVAIPVMLAATLLRIKRVSLEPNVVPGLVNRLLAPLCHLVVTTFEASSQGLRSKNIKRLGIPVRPEIFRTNPVKKKEEILTLLILGGSQGAHSINKAMVSALPFLKKQKVVISIIHQTGKSDCESVRNEYDKAGFQAKITPFIDEIVGVYEMADLIISRAGAGTLSEIAIVGKPTLLIPFPHAAGHQIENAKAFVSVGAAIMLLDHELDGPGLAESILLLFSDPKRLKKMGRAAKNQGKPNAAEDIVNACFVLAKEP